MLKVFFENFSTSIAQFSKSFAEISPCDKQPIIKTFDFSKFAIQACEYALANIESEKKEK